MAIVIGPPPDLYKAARRVKRTRGYIILGYFEKQGARIPASCVGDDRLQQRRADSRPTSLGEDAEGQDLAFLAETLGQRQPRNVVILPGDSAKKSGYGHDLRDRLRRPWIVGKTSAVELRQRPGERSCRVPRDPLDPAGHAPTDCCRPPAGVTSGGRR